MKLNFNKLNEESIKGEHLCPKLARKLTTQMKAKRLILTHTYPERQGREKDMHQEARNYHTREIIFTLRHILCTLTTNIHSSLKGTDLIVLAYKKTEPKP